MRIQNPVKLFFTVRPTLVKVCMTEDEVHRLIEGY